MKWDGTGRDGMGQGLSMQRKPAQGVSGIASSHCPLRRLSHRIWVVAPWRSPSQGNHLLWESVGMCEADVKMLRGFLLLGG